MDLTSISTSLAKSFMKKFETFPISPEVKVGELEEVFNHSIFVNATNSQRQAVRIDSSISKYKSEVSYPWDCYHGTNLTPYLQGKNVLEIGCFSGGRGIAWYEKYQMASLTGVDVVPEYIEAATQFAQLKKVNAKYMLGKGESLPFNDESFDAIVSFDVFEHIQNVEQTLSECYRVLRSGGLVFMSFPGYYHPTHHHLALVTKIPCLHYFFSGKTLVRAYYEILQERGEDA